jgi:TPR repeat protein
MRPVIMYAHGIGVPKDEIEGLAWFSISAASGDETSIKDRDKMEARLGPDATLLAQQRSKALLLSSRT